MEAVPPDEMMATLVEHAAHGRALAGAALPSTGEPLTREDALKLALEIAHKTAWRCRAEDRTDAAVAMRRERFVRVVHAALAPQLSAWGDLAAALPKMNDAQLLGALGGEPAGGPVGTRPLVLYELLCDAAARAHDAAAAAGGAPTADDVWLTSAALGEGSMLRLLLASLRLSDNDAQRLGALLQRVQAIAALQAAAAAAATPAGGGVEGDDWVDVDDAMQM